jgi:hypothetical protein
MTVDQETLLQVMCARAGISDEQLDAVRHGDVSELLRQVAASSPDEQRSRREETRRHQRRLEVTQARLDAAVSLLLQVADVLGCCRRCWGTNPQCPACAGQGTPGFREPDPGLLGWLGPALSRVRPLPPPQTTDTRSSTTEGAQHD